MGLLDAAPTGAGSQLTIDPDLVPLPLGGEPAEPPPAPLASEVASGAAAGEPWSLTATWNGIELSLKMLVPGESDGFAGGMRGEPDTLLGHDANWHLDQAAGGLVLWGPVGPEAAMVVVTLDDGTKAEIEPLRAVPTSTCRSSPPISPTAPPHGGGGPGGGG